MASVMSTKRETKRDGPFDQQMDGERQPSDFLIEDRPIEVGDNPSQRLTHQQPDGMTAADAP